jgi:hypothetical protein
MPRCPSNVESLVLSPAEEEQLQQLIRAQSTPQGLAQRARVVQQRVEGACASLRIEADRQNLLTRRDVVTCSISSSSSTLASLFSGLLIRLEILLAAISLAANGRKISFPDSPASHCSWVSGGRMTGIRVCIWATNSFGSPVMIMQVRNHSLVSGFCVAAELSVP